MIRAALIAIGLVGGCCRKPPPAKPKPPIVITEKRCLEGIEPPPDIDVQAMACVGDAWLCLSRVEATRLRNQIRALYVYRERTKRCRGERDPKPAKPEETK